MSTCAHCGYTSEANKAFCSQCGNRLARQKTAPTHVVKPRGRPEQIPPLVTSLQAPKQAPESPLIPTPAAISPKRPSRGIPKLGVLLFSVLLAFTLVWGVAGTLPGLGRFPLREAFQKFFGTLPSEMIELAPEDADLYLEIQVGQTEQVLLFNNILARFPHSARWQSQFIDLFTVQSSETSPSLSWAADVAPWLGERVGLTADIVPDPEGTLMAHMAFFFETTSITATNSFVQQLIDSEQAIHTEMAYNKSIITKLQAIDASQIQLPLNDQSLSEPRPEITPLEPEASAGYLLLVGDYLVVSNSYDFLTHMIDSWAKRKNFTKKDSYKAANAMLSSESLGKLFIAPHSMPPALFELIAFPSLLFDVPKANAAAAEQKSLPELMGLSVVATQEGLRLDLTLPDHGLSVLPRTLDRGLTARIPGEALFFASLADFRAGLDNYFTALSAVDPTIGFAYDDFIAGFADDTAGFDLDADVLSLLADDVALVLTYEKQFPQLSFVALLGDPKAAEDRIRKTIDFVEAILITTASLTSEQPLVPEDFSLFAEIRLPGDLPAWQLQHTVLPDYIDLAYARIDNLLVVSTSPDGLAAFAEVNKHIRPSLADTPRFALPAETVPAGALGLLYFDREKFSAALNDLYQTTEAPSEGRLDLSSLSAGLAPWQDVFGYLVRTEEGTVVFSLNLPVQEAIQEPKAE